MSQYCKYCGQSLTQGNGFCQSCGKKVEIHLPPKSIEQPKAQNTLNEGNFDAGYVYNPEAYQGMSRSTKRRYLIGYVVAIFIVLGIIGTVFLFGVLGLLP